MTPVVVASLISRPAYANPEIPFLIHISTSIPTIMGIWNTLILTNICMNTRILMNPGRILIMPIISMMQTTNIRTALRSW
ncbi:MAG: hypothetical protein PHD25_03010 [Bacteroidales bacterium]|nr:hypothetical protein [Bacteroidales bacterium]